MNNKVSITNINPIGRKPFLYWSGKKPLEYVKSFPIQLLEVFNFGSNKKIVQPLFKELEDQWHNLIFHGDNKEILGSLLLNGFRGKVDLIYIDPPFDSGANYVRKITLRRNNMNSLKGEDYTLAEQIQYHDIWIKDSFLQFMYERLILLKEILNETGSIFINVDEHKGHYIRFLMDEVFGSDNFVNEIIWHYPDNFQGNVKGLANNHQAIYWYSKSNQYTANTIKEKLNKPKKRDKRVWSKELQKLVALKDAEGKTVYNEYTEKKLDDVWSIGQTSTSKSTSNEYSGYPTQKPEELLRRIIELASNPGDLVLDSFMGSGTTMVVAEKLSRRWIGCDINKGAIQTTIKRLQLIKEKWDSRDNFQEKIIDDQTEDTSFPFCHYKVNDYDLQVLRTEAIDLAIEHIGIERTYTDPFFNGTLGNSLVKIVDFNHPLTRQDLELIKQELKLRPEEDRSVKIICLGKESLIDSLVVEHNKKHILNKFEVIELRSDMKYGKFLIHKPPTANVIITRKEDKAVIEIKDFLSPTIIERLDNENNLIKVSITDFRSMIDVVLIDSNYDNLIFNTLLSDVPAKNEFIKGKYEVTIPDKKCKIAIKIIDMLGEEIMIIQDVP